MSNRNKPTKNRPQQQQVTFQQTKFYQGPLPAPETLQQYEQIQPGFANRIMTLAEGEALHRRSLEGRVITINTVLSFAGMLCGLLSIAGVLWLCYYAFSLGYDTAAATIATGVLIGIGGVFLYRKSRKPDS